MSSPRRVADAATGISPFPFVARQGASNPSSDNVEGRQGKSKKSKPVPKPESRIPRPDEGMRFNLGPRSFRNPSSNRRQSRFMPGRQDLGYPEDQEGIPNYPPPSFQEAMTSPALSVCSSTTSLVPAPTIPLAISTPILPTEQAAANPASSNLLQETIASDNGSDSGSIEIVEMDSVPPCDDILSMCSESRSRLGVNFPASPSAKTPHAQTGFSPTSSRARPPRLNLDPQAVSSDDFSQSPMTPKRRFLSLSPLKTIFPSKFSSQQDRAMSAHPTPNSSPLYPPSRSVFFKSSTSLSSPSIFRFTPQESGKGDGLRRMFSHKAREKERVEPFRISENLDTWEVVAKEDADEKTSAESNDDIHPPSLMSAMQSIAVSPPAYGGTSPTRSQSFTFGTRNPRRGTQLSAGIVTDSQNMQAASYSSQSLSLRDVKSPFIDRRVKRTPKPAPVVPEVTDSTVDSLPPVIEDPAVPLGPTLTTVRVREGAAVARSTSPAAPIPKHPAQVTIPSPLRIDSKPANTVADEPPSPSPSPSIIHQQALAIPLPVTPVKRTHPDNGPDNITHISPARSIPDLLTDSNSANDVCCHCAGVSPSPSISVMTVNGSTKFAIPEEPITPSRHHYTGRPLPRPPPSLASRPAIDSTYAGATPESPGHRTNSRDRSSPAFTEGLLIDLNDTSYDDLPGSGASTPRLHDSQLRSQTHLPTIPVRSSDTELLVDITTESSTILPSPRQGPPSIVSPAPLALPGTQLSQLTELDLLVSQVGEGRRNGSDYETLLLIEEVLGPASPTHPRTVPLQPSTSQTPNGNDNVSLIGRIEVERRRTLKDGRVKIKLSLMNVPVNKCGICLSQFKNGDMAGLTSLCNHAFHETCLGKWLPRSKTCPLCRVSLDADAR